MKILEKSEVVENKGSGNTVYIHPVTKTGDKHFTILSADKIVRCERKEIGLTSNCAICQNINKEMFDRCKHRWVEY